jgi:hypothetical protein
MCTTIQILAANPSFSNQIKHQASKITKAPTQDCNKESNTIPLLHLNTMTAPHSYNRHRNLADEVLRNLFNNRDTIKEEHDA